MAVVPSFLSLGDDVLLHILELLSVDDITALRKVCMVFMTDVYGH